MSVIQKHTHPALSCQ